MQDTLRQKIAYHHIEKDPHLQLTKEQKETVKSQLKKVNLNLNDSLRRSYRIIGLPEREGFKRLDLGVPTYGVSQPLDIDVYNRLRTENEILETIAPIPSKQKIFFSKEIFN